MEGAGAEPVSPNSSFFQTADGGASRYARLHRRMVYAIFLLPVGWCDDALWMVAAIAVSDEKDIRHFLSMGSAITHPRSPALDN